MTREEFNTKYEGIVKEISRLDNSNETFNIFKILGLTDYEIRHSNFLAWLLKNEMFFKEFIELYNEAVPKTKKISDKTFNKEIRIKREEHFEEVNKEGKARFTHTDKDQTICRDGSEEDGYSFFRLTKNNGKVDEKSIDGKEYLNKNKSYWKNGRSIDLNIIGDDFTITIENKIDSGEHDFQCIAYRNYVENKEEYKGKKHYYVFLGKEIPGDFDTDVNRGLYPEYVFIKYNQIRDILINPKIEFGFDNIQKVIVDHYCSVINEWKEIPEDYVNCLTKFEKDKNEDLSFLTDRKSFADASDSLTQEEERFVELAKRYYTQKKEEVDKIIKPAVVVASRESYFIKTEYGRGNYAVAIPLSPEVFNYKEKKIYLEHQYLINKEKTDNFNVITEDEIEEIKKYNEKQSEDKKKTIEKLMDAKIKMILKEKDFIPKKDWAFQTVDYRAPMEGLNNPSIGIISGLSKYYSINLCEYLKDNNFINDLDNLTDWSKELRFYFKNGSAYNQNSIGIKCNYDAFKSNRGEILYPEKILGENIHGKKENVFNKEFEKYFKILKDINLFDSNKFSEWKDELRKYFSDGGKCVFFGWSLSLKYEIKNFDEKYKNNKYALKDLFIEKTLEGVTPFGDKYKKWFENNVFNKQGCCGDVPC